LLDRRSRPNAALSAEGIACLDVHGIGAWLVEVLGQYRGLAVEAIVPVGHGAGAALLDKGRLAFAPLDYEQPLPAAVMAAYRGERDPFILTGSPALPGGLNLGAQLYWLERLHPEVMRRGMWLPWAQYWAWFLSGETASEVTSLGCHSDLWAPAAATFSPMARRLGWAERCAPLRRAGEVVGTLRPELAVATGLATTTRVLTGLHDSNAALLAARGFAEIEGREATILSTGTWFVAMRVVAGPVSIDALPEARDCLVNIDVDGCPVPSARFMGGREIRELVGIEAERLDIAEDQAALIAAAADVVAGGTMVLPTLAPGCGPFPDAVSRWVKAIDDPLARRAAVCLYAALVADRSLDLIGARDRLVVEGRFARVDLFTRALASLRQGAAVYAASSEIDVAFGALRLVHPRLAPPASLAPVPPLPVDLAAYRRAWFDEINLTPPGEQRA
jgi:sugar (pentulose or hexulose) kinase